jgi:hypothetical protein
MTQRFIRIVRIPPGEAPEWVRKAWIGLILPLKTGIFGPVRTEGIGVVTGKSVGEKDVFPVSAILAIDILARDHEEAAYWWQSRGMYVPWFDFQFDASACELLPADF